MRSGQMVMVPLVTWDHRGEAATLIHSQTSLLGGFCYIFGVGNISIFLRFLPLTKSTFDSEKWGLGDVSICSTKEEIVSTTNIERLTG